MLSQLSYIPLDRRIFTGEVIIQNWPTHVKLI